MNETNPKSDYSLNSAKRIGPIVLVVFTVIWVLSITALNLFLRWSIEQSMFETDTGMNDGRWLVNLVCGVFLFVPLLALYFSVKVPRFKLMLRLWATAAGFVLLSGPAKILYLTSQIQSYVLLSAVLALITLILWLLRKKRPIENKGNRLSSLLGTTLLLCMAFTTPWILWGAFGSTLDLVVVLLFGLVFAAFIIFVVFPDYFAHTQPPGTRVDRGDFLFDGFVLMVFLFIMVSGLSQNGSQPILCLTLPAAGWLLSGIAAAGHNFRDHGKVAVGLVSGLLLALPLAFFDMDELALVIAGNSEEVFYWATRAGWNTLIFLVAIAIMILVFFKYIERANVEKHVAAVLIILSIVEMGVLYFIAGQPGFYGDRVFVVMKEQVNPGRFSDIADYSEKKQVIYRALTDTAENTQNDLMEWLEKRGIHYTSYYLVNGLEVNAGVLFKNSLKKKAGVDRVLDSPRLRPLPRPIPQSKGEVTEPGADSLWNLDMINAQKAQQEFGTKGAGIIIGQTDSGVDGTHPELIESYRGKNVSHDYNWLDPWNQSVSPADFGGHGTGTTAIILGATRGVAPEAQWIGCVNLARNLGNPAYYLDCMQFMFAPYPQGGDPFKHGKPELGAMIVNNSWGCPRVEGCDVDVFRSAMVVLQEAGVFMAVSAGNNGYYGCSTITDPLAIYEESFTVGSVDRSGEISAFSSRGPVQADGSLREKPDLLAPGEDVLVAAPGGTYTYSSGTSFSAPHVAGVVALMWSANPNLIGDVIKTKQILMQTAQPFSGRSSGCGGAANEGDAGILDAYAAVNAALAVK